MKPELELQLERCRSLPTLPAVALQVLKLCQSDEVDMQELARTIGRDPALTAKVLRVANSPLFNMRREVTRLSQAIVWLGVQSVRTLALGFSLVQDIKTADHQGFDHARFWRRSIVSAVVARELATHMGLGSWEETFLGALLQDIGMIALAHATESPWGPAPQGEVRRMSHSRLIAAERAAIGSDHAEIGAWLARKWGLPEPLQAAIAQSHKEHIDELQGHPEATGVARCVALSGWLADIFVEEDIAQATEVVRARAMTLLGFDQEALTPILGRIAEGLPEVSTLFEIKLGSEREIAGILDQAREALVMLNLQSDHRASRAEKAISDLQLHTLQLQERSDRDDLTGLFRRNRMEEFLLHEFNRSTFLKKPLSVMFCDIDHFKNVNDTYGHQCGDEVLASVAGLLKRDLRDVDMAARYGGEEFLVALPGVDAREAALVAERLRYSVERSSPASTQKGLRVTISVGFATLSEPGRYPDPAGLVRAADEALYKAKRTGRNRVIGSEHFLHAVCA